MHDALWDALAVKVRHLVDEGDILQQKWSTLSDAHRGGLLTHRLAVARGDDGVALLRGREGVVKCCGVAVLWGWGDKEVWSENVR